MATKEKDDVSAPIAVLLMFLAFALAAGGIGNLGDGGGGGGGRSTSNDPCDGEPASHVVADWPTRTGNVELKCGDWREGWEHLRIRDRLKGDRDNILNCIGRTLARGEVRPRPSRINPQWVYRWKWGDRSGEVAVVRVGQRTDSLITAHPGSGPTAKLWARCAGR